jgi:hypothetical protein
MTEDGKSAERVTFSRGYDVCLMAIDGTWRRDCQLNAISDTDATLTVEGSIQGLNLKEFFLLLSSTGLAYRRCELVRVNGTEMDIRFLRGKVTGWPDDLKRFAARRALHRLDEQRCAQGVSNQNPELRSRRRRLPSAGTPRVTFLGGRCYLCVQLPSRTNMIRYGVDTVIRVCVTFYHAWTMEHG